MLMFSLISVSVITISWYGLKQFSEAQEDALSISHLQQSERIFEKLNDRQHYWRSLIAAQMQTMILLTPEQFKSQIQAFINSNKKIQGINIQERIKKAIFLTPLRKIDPLKKKRIENLLQFENAKLQKLDKVRSNGETIALTEEFTSLDAKIKISLAIDASDFTNLLSSVPNQKTAVVTSSFQPLAWDTANTKNWMTEVLKTDFLKSFKNSKARSLLHWPKATAYTKPALALTKSPESDFILLSETDLIEKLNTMKQKIVKLILLTVTLIWITLGAAIYPIRSLLKRLFRVIEVTTIIARGQFLQRTHVTGSDEVALLGYSVDHMAVSLENLMKVREQSIRQLHELETAQIYQSTLLPIPVQRSDNMSRLSVTGRCQSSSECSGDWWGHYALDAHRTLVAVADVTGHGAGAAILGAAFFGFFEGFVRNTPGTEQKSAYSDGRLVASCLKQLNQILWISGKGLSTATMHVTIVNTMRNCVTFSNAGHLPPLLMLPKSLKADRSIRLVFNENLHQPGNFESKPTNTQTSSGTMEKVFTSLSLVCAGPILGTGPCEEFPVCETDFLEGELLFIYTDGLTECPTVANKCLSKKQISTMLAELMVESSSTREKFFAQIENILPKSGNADDITTVFIEYAESAA
jgi:serine phosphatase RsbU (regulator of sigma subunit)